MRASWRTAWQGQDIVVFKNEVEAYRVPADQVRKVMLVHRSNGESPSDLVQAVVETADEYLIFPTETGIAGPVNFERQAYWAERGCVYWVAEAKAPMPMRLRRGPRFLGFGSAGFSQVPHADLASLIERWPLEGPQTWEQRKWRRIERSRPFSQAAKEAREAREREAQEKRQARA